MFNQLPPEDKLTAAELAAIDLLARSPNFDYSLGRLPSMVESYRAGLIRQKRSVMRVHPCDDTMYDLGLKVADSRNTTTDDPETVNCVECGDSMDWYKLDHRNPNLIAKCYGCKFKYIARPVVWDVSVSGPDEWDEDE